MINPTEHDQHTIARHLTRTTKHVTNTEGIL